MIPATVGFEFRGQGDPSLASVSSGSHDNVQGHFSTGLSLMKTRISSRSSLFSVLATAPAASITQPTDAPLAHVSQVGACSPFRTRKDAIRCYFHRRGVLYFSVTYFDSVLRVFEGLFLE